MEYFIFVGLLGTVSSFSTVSITIPTTKSTLEQELIRLAKEKPTEEDRYVNYFYHNQECDTRMWSAMKKVYYEEHNETLLKLCADVHGQATKNASSFNVQCAYIHPKMLGFRKEAYFPIRVDVVTCEILENSDVGNVTITFHITEGRRPDCVYFLESAPSDLSDINYLLDKLVCDISIDEVEDPLII